MNNARRIALAVLAALMLYIGETGSATASTAPVFRHDFVGAGAFAFFRITEGCTQTYVYIQASDGRHETSFPKADSMFTSVSEFDTCENRFILGASDSYTLNPDALHVSGQTATLAVTVEMLDQATHATVPTQFSVSWTGIAPATRDTYISATNGPFGTTVFRSVGSQQAAVATGTVVYDGTSIDLNTPEEADLYWNNSGYIEVTK
jgi:hypothetical protein